VPENVPEHEIETPGCRTCPLLGASAVNWKEEVEDPDVLPEPLPGELVDEHAARRMTPKKMMFRFMLSSVR
jgi:hypothetical protein